VDYYKTAARLIRIYGAIPSCIPFMNGRALPPLFLFLELTYQCNLRCPYCYVYPAGKKPKHRELEELTAAEIGHIVDQTPPWTLIFLSGGEVLIRNDFDKILRRIARKRLCHIYTNGTMISPADVEQWVTIGVSSVAFSVDGPKWVHDAIRGRGTFSSIMSAVEMLSRARKRKAKRFPLINLRTTITAQNAGSLTDMIRVAEEVGADYCTFQVLNHTTRLGGVNLQDDLECNLQPPPITAFPTYTLADQLSRLRNASSSRIRVRILPDLPVSSLLSHYENRLQPRNYSCVSPWTVMYVSPFGEVYPCLNYRVGNLREQPLGKVWNCLRYRQFRLQLLRHGLFADCCGCCDLLRRHPLGRSCRPTTHPAFSS
jgi:radical SAM protein with 4Fe4S-binding SPASM domain